MRRRAPLRLARRQVLRLLASGVAVSGLVGLVAARQSGATAARSDDQPAETPRPMLVFYSPEYALSAHSFETTRKARWVADSLASDPIPGLALVAPTPLTEAELEAVHDPAYVEAVRTGQPRDLAQSQGFAWDPGLWTMVLASNGGAVEAARTALREGGVAGSLSSGLHHAAYGRGKGFCTFNGLALAARAVLEGGASRLLIVDLDAHCGGGTHSLIAADDRVWQLDVAVNAFDSYSPAQRNTLDLVRSAADYLPTIAARLEELPSRAPRFDLCLYNAGMDPHEGCPVGGMSGITTEVIAARERMVFDWCRAQGLPVAFVLAGGYTGPTLDQAGLVQLHRLTIASAAGAPDAA